MGITIIPAPSASGPSFLPLMPQVGEVIGTPTFGIAGNGVFMTQNQTCYQPVFLSSSATYDKISVRTFSPWSGTATLRLGIYGSDSTTRLPSTLILDAGTVSATAQNTTYSITISQTLNAGLYYLAINMQSTAPSTFNMFAHSNLSGSSFNLSTLFAGVLNQIGVQQSTYYTQSGVTGAFSNAGTVTGSNSGPTPIVLLSRSA